MIHNAKPNWDNDRTNHEISPRIYDLLGKIRSGAESGFGFMFGCPAKKKLLTTNFHRLIAQDQFTSHQCGVNFRYYGRETSVYHTAQTSYQIRETN